MFVKKRLKPPPSFGCLGQRVKNVENLLSQWPRVQGLGTFVGKNLSNFSFFLLKGPIFAWRVKRLRDATCTSNLEKSPLKIGQSPKVSVFVPSLSPDLPDGSNISQ